VADKKFVATVKTAFAVLGLPSAADVAIGEYALVRELLLHGEWSLALQLLSIVAEVGNIPVGH